MTLTWTAPSALWLLAAVPLVWLAHSLSRTSFNPRQRRLQAAIRSLLLAALSIALARPILSTSAARQSIVYLVDVSHSISSRAIEDASRQIDGFQSVLRPEHSKIIAFGGMAAPVADTAALRRLADVDAEAGGVGPLERHDTDLESALGAGRAELAAAAVPRIVLFTDGRATLGDAPPAIARLAAAHIPVSVEPMAVRSLGDAWVESVDVPARIAAGAAFSAIVHTGSQRGGLAIVELRSETAVLGRRQVRLTAGLTSVALGGAIDVPGSHALRASVSLPGDPLAANDALDRETWVDPRPKVLYIEGTPASARYLSDALGRSGFDVTAGRPSALPSTSAALEPWDVVVLSDVGRSAIAAAPMRALADWVENGGGGLLVAGGEAIFGTGGYHDTAIERLTPVTFERREEPELALVLVLDRSWSMVGSSIDLCKAAAQAAVDVMKDTQAVGIVTFNDQFEWNVPLREVGANRAEIRDKIAAISPSGPTRIFPALEQAYLALRSAKARAKHVVVLSDGRSLPDDYEGLVRKMTAARMTVSSVAVGPSADRDLLRSIARWGTGRDYSVQNASDLPEVFVKEAKNAAAPAFDEKEIAPVVKAPAFLRGVNLTRIPHLSGITATVIKDTALEVLSTADGDPLLAFWPVGLGRTAVFASDVKDRWGAAWIRWREYAPFFASVVRAIERQRPLPLALDVAPGPIHGATRSIAVSVEARDPAGRYRSLLHPVVRVEPDRGSPVDVPLRQVSAGRYEGTVLADADRRLKFTVAGAEGGITSRLVLPDPAAEYRFRPADDALLQSIASATGGLWKPAPAALAAAPGERRTVRRALWPMLMVIALCLWFVDLLLRRVRVFEAAVVETAAPQLNPTRTGTRQASAS